MIKKILNISLFMCLACAASAQSPVDVRKLGVISSEQAHNTVWENKLYRQVEFLSDSLCGGRATGTRGSTEAAFWIARRFGQLGLLPFSGQYTKHFYGPFGRNMIGMIPGNSRGKNDSYVLVLAHYDGLGTLNGKLYPGADSNASGVVAMVSIAEMFSAMRLLGRAYDTNVIFAAVDAKSSSMKGSRAFAFRIRNHILSEIRSTIEKKFGSGRNKNTRINIKLTNTPKLKVRSRLLDLLSSYFREVRILVRAQQDLTTSSHVLMASLVRRIDSLLDLASISQRSEATLLLYVEEQLPSHISQRVGQYLYIIPLESTKVKEISRDA